MCRVNKVYNLHNFTAVLQMLWFGKKPAKIEGTHNFRDTTDG